MSDSHSATVGPQQLTQRIGPAAQCDIIPEGSRHPPPSFRGLATNGDRPVEDLEVKLLCLISDVRYWKLYIVSVPFCVDSLTTDRTLASDGGALDIYTLTTKHHDSKD